MLRHTSSPSTSVLSSSSLLSDLVCTAVGFSTIGDRQFWVIRLSVGLGGSGSSVVGMGLRWLVVEVVVVIVSAARRVHFSRGLPEYWILPYLSTLVVGALELAVGFGGSV